MKLKFYLDYECNPLWANDDESIEKYGFHIDDLTKLGLSPSTIDFSDRVIEIYSEYLNPIYQGFPSFWSGDMHIYFQSMARKLYSMIQDDIGTTFEIENKEEQLINESIDRDQIDIKLNDFINDPEAFCKRNGISFGSMDDLIAEVNQEYDNWKLKEFKIL